MGSKFATVPTTAHRRRPGIVIHRVRALHPRDICVVDGIPVTTVPRVLLDLAPSLDGADLTRACHEAWVHHRVTPKHIEACIARNPGKPGAAKLRRAFGADVTLSKLEDLFLKLVRAHDLPAPRTNIDVPRIRSADETRAVHRRSLPRCNASFTVRGGPAPQTQRPPSRREGNGDGPSAGGCPPEDVG
ncbi:MAG: hypothetical protein WKF96_21170 [Solirubrobacteraceae bacterium]